MSTTYGWYVDLLIAKYIDARTANTNFQTYRNDAQSYYNIGNDHAALGSLLTACSYAWQALNFIIGYTGTTWPYYAIANVLIRGFEQTYEFTTQLPLCMAQLINAMLPAKFDELQYFIGIEDAYRMALWNAPFNANFYAALARGFMRWP